jgi:hypothetical protein
VRWLLAWRPSALAAHLARLLTVVATLACMLVNEVARLQVWDLWCDNLALYGVPGFQGTCSVHRDRRKNDTVRKGHYPASAARGTLRSTSWCSFGRGCWSQGWLSTRPAPSRPDQRHAVLYAPSCSQSRGERRAESRCSRTSHAPASRRLDWNQWAVSQAGGDSARFSVISAKKGDISSAIEAGLD